MCQRMHAQNHAYAYICMQCTSTNFWTLICQDFQYKYLLFRLNQDIHGFPQVLRTWLGVLQNLMGVGGGAGDWVKSWGSIKGLKMVVKNTYEGVHLLVKLPAISLQACKFTKSELLHLNLSMILDRF